MNLTMYYKSYRKGIQNLLSPFRESLSIRVLQNIAYHYAVTKMIRITYDLIEYK